MGLYKNKCSPVPVFILHNKLFQVKWARIPGSREKVPSFLKMAGTFKSLLRQRPTAGKHDNTKTPSQTPEAHRAGSHNNMAHHDRFQRLTPDTPHSKRKSLRGFFREGSVPTLTYFIKNFCRSASVVSSPIVISSVPVRRANIAISSLVSAVDTTE